MSQPSFEDPTAKVSPTAIGDPTAADDAPSSWAKQALNIYTMMLILSFLALLTGPDQRSVLA